MLEKVDKNKFKALFSSLILFAVSVIVVLSLETLLEVFLLVNMENIYNLIVNESLLVKGNYVSIVLLMLAEAALISWTCERFFQNLHLNTKFLMALFVFIFGMWLILSAETTSYIPILLGLTIVSFFTILIGFMMFNDCNSKKQILG